MKNIKKLTLLLFSIILLSTSCTSESEIPNENTKIEESKETQKEIQKEIQKESTEISKNNFEEAKVIRVVDGDTIIVNRGYGEERLRLILADTPETVHPNKPVEAYGKEASNFTKSKLENKTVYLQQDVSDKDRYDRLLRYVWLKKPSSNEPNKDEIKKYMINAILIAEGYGQIATFPPDVKYVEYFKELETNARNNNLGLWQYPEHQQEEVHTDSEPENLEEYYIGNMNSKVFHRPNCASVNKMSQRNRIRINNRRDCINQTYKPCGICKP